MEINASIILGIFGIGITALNYYFINRLTHDKLEKELFTEFNNRYDKLNDYLEQIITNCANEKNLDNYPELRIKLIDYFNLCAEEYYWQNKKRINPKIWKSWQKGMNYWYNKSEAIRNEWAKEIQNEGYLSYYLKNEKQLFQSEIKKQ